MLKKIVVASLAPLVLCPVLLAADWKVVIREWDVPTPNSRPHDPEVAPDGALWYTGQLANKLGRLNPATGAIKEFSVKTRDSGPHGLAADKDGNIWFTANSKSYIGKLDPSTGAVTEYPMPDPAARDPHSLVFDRDGMIFFTVQNGNFAGRLDPKTGKVVLKSVPTPRARPYGIIVGPDGAAYFCEFGSNKIGRVDPKTLEITEYTLPEGARPRRITNNPDRFIYYSDFGRGFIGRLEPRSGKVEEWPSPGGPESRPYGIASTADGMVWYSESGVKPNTLVVFDPRGKSFQIWPIPSGGGVVRNMVATPDGRLYLACSGVNKVAIATPTRHKAAGLLPDDSAYVRIHFPSSGCRPRCPWRRASFADDSGGGGEPTEADIGPGDGAAAPNSATSSCKYDDAPRMPSYLRSGYLATFRCESLEWSIGRRDLRVAEGGGADHLRLQRPGLGDDGSGSSASAVGSTDDQLAEPLEDLRGEQRRHPWRGHRLRSPAPRFADRPPDPSAFARRMDRITVAMRASGYSGAAVAKVRGGNRGLTGRHQTRRVGVLRGRAL